MRTLLNWNISVIKSKSYGCWGIWFAGAGAFSETENDNLWFGRKLLNAIDRLRRLLLVTLTSTKLNSCRQEEIFKLLLQYLLGKGSIIQVLFSLQPNRIFEMGFQEVRYEKGPSFWISYSQTQSFFFNNKLFCFSFVLRTRAKTQSQLSQDPTTCSLCWVLNRTPF